MTMLAICGQWDSRYPDKTALRREVEVMGEAAVEALLANIPRDQIEAVYLKGSATKPWDSPIDYVAELSDIDIHIMFTDDEAVRRHLDPVRQGLYIQAQMEAVYLRVIPHPLHMPRVQFTVANTLIRQPDYVPSPPDAVTVVMGQLPSHQSPDTPSSRLRARNQLLGHAEFLSTLGQHIADMPGRHLWFLVRGMGWRVAPTGPRVLELLGLRFDETWRLNRTETVERLRQMGQADLAESYATFYLSCWDCSLSDYADYQALRRAAAAGAAVLQHGIAIGLTPAQP